MLKKKLKLSALSEAMLKDKEMSSLFGGGEPRYCTCSCAFEGKPGGASSEENKAANYSLGSYGGYSTTGCNQYYMSSTSGTYAPDPAFMHEGV